MNTARRSETTAFSIWMRTGRWPQPRATRSVELKFNPWHDPQTGRFTFAGTGNFYGPGSVQSAARANQDVPPYGRDAAAGTVSNMEEVHAWAARERAKYAGKPNEQAHFRRIDQAVREYAKDFGRSIDALEKLGDTPGAPGDTPGTPSSASVTPSNGPGKPGDFIGGFGKGAYDAGKAAATGLYSLVTTNPLTSARNIGLGIAGMIDTALEAEDTPAHVQFSRAASAISKASAYDIGYALGQVSSNVVLTAVPGTALAKVSAVARAGRIGGVARSVEKVGARFGVSKSSDYRATLFDAYPELKSRVIVHHAVEQQVLKLFPGVVSKIEIHSFENLRGIPKEINAELHSGAIRSEWNRFYRSFEARGLTPTKNQLLRKAMEIDSKHGSKFNPPR